MAKWEDSSHLSLLKPLLFIHVNDGKRFKTLLQVRRIWLKKCAPALDSRPKWTSENRDLTVDDVVLVIQPDSPRGCWLLGKLLKCILEEMATPV